jgi:hypothetical protein
MPIFASPDPIVLRPATASDAGALERLAALDSSPVPAGDLLVAEVAGELRAALRIDDAVVIADPFVRTAGLVDLLAARAAHLRGSDRHGLRARLAHRQQRWQRGGMLHPTG